MHIKNGKNRYKRKVMIVLIIFLFGITLGCGRYTEEDAEFIDYNFAADQGDNVGASGPSATDDSYEATPAMDSSDSDADSEESDKNPEESEEELADVY